MTSKAERRRRKAAQRARGQSQGQKVQNLRAVEKRTRAAVRATLTPEQHKKGGYEVRPSGQVVRRDLMTELYLQGHLTDQQYDAAQMFMEIRQAYKPETGTRGYGSCLADNLGSYKSDDGNLRAVLDYRHLEEKVGFSLIAHLAQEVFKTVDEKPGPIADTRRALNKIAEL